MKVFIIACLAVAAMAEADPALVYTNGMYHTGFPMVNSYIHSPIVSSLHPVQYVAQPTMKKAEEKPEVMEKKVEVEVEVEKKPETIVYSGIHPSQYINPFVQTYIKPVVVGPRYVAKNGEVEHIVHKREAEAEPWTVVGSPFYSGLHHPRFYTQPAAYYTNKATFINPYTGDVTGKITNDAITPTNYANKRQYVARAPGTHTVHIAKREAEAEALNVLPSPYFYGNPVVHSYAHQPFVFKTPFVNTYAKHFAYAAPTGVEGVLDGKTVADDAWQWTPNYASKHMYVAKTPGTTHIAKREAEADPLTVLRSPFYSSLYPTTHAYYNTYPYTYSNLYNRVYQPSSIYSPYYY